MNKELFVIILSILVKYGPAAYSAVLDILKKDTYTIEELVALKASFVLYKDL